MKRKLTVAVLGLLVVLTGCVRPGVDPTEYPLREGAYNEFDSRAFDQINAAQIELEEARAALSELPRDNAAYQLLARAFNEATDVHFAAVQAYEGYRSVLALGDTPEDDVREAQRVMDTAVLEMIEAVAEVSDLIVRSRQ